MCLIAFTLSGKGIIVSLVILKQRYSKLSMAKKGFETQTIFTFLDGLQSCPLLMSKRSSIKT